MKALLIATRRKGKLAEAKAILKDLNLKIVSLKEINFPDIEPKEDGKTFKDNAVIKAKFYGQRSDLLTLADDSGLEVKALPGKLGVKSKRYGPGTDQDRLEKLLKEMENIPDGQRQAQFVSVIAIFDPKNGKLKTAKGIWKGKISHKPKGKYGFGYDPIFIANGVNKRFAQLSLKEKNKISHRARALEELKKYLRQYEA